MTTTQFVSFLPTLLQGFLTTLLATALSIITSIACGCLTSLFIAFNNKFLSAILKIYISIFRNSPLLVQMFLLFYGLPFVGIRLSPLLCGVIAITLNEGAFIAEIMRGALNSVPKGEIEAAYSLGLTKAKVVFKVMFPLALKSSVPVILGQTSIVLKDTSLLSMIMIQELTRAANVYYSRYFSVTVIWLVAFIYIAIFLVMYLIGKKIERKVIVRR